MNFCRNEKDWEKNARPILEWIQAATDDGWSSGPTYESEPVAWAGRMEKEGFVVSYLLRPIGRKGFKDRIEKSGEVALHGWCPKGISIRFKHPYSWEQIQAETTRCPQCGKGDVKTVRVGFANRACEDCEPDMRKRIETPGWCS